MRARTYWRIVGGVALLIVLSWAVQWLPRPTVLAAVVPPGQFLPALIVSPRVAPNELQQAFPSVAAPFSGEVRDLGPVCLYVSWSGAIYGVRKAALWLETRRACP